MPGKRSPEFRAFYSNVQAFAVTGTEILLTFLRVEPEMDEKGTRYKTGDTEFIEEATVYLQVAKAKEMCQKLLKIIEQAEKAAEPSKH